VGAGDAGELDRAVAADDAAGLDELNLVMIMATDSTVTVTATSRTNPQTGHDQGIPLLNGLRPPAGRLMQTLPWPRHNRIAGLVGRVR
jgi:hypothetical protein